MNSINKKFSLVGKIALITGATGHLGQQMALALSEAGAHVLVNSRSSKNAMLLVKKIKQNKLIAEEAIFDVTEEKDVKNFFSSYDKKLNIIVNNSHAETFGTIEKSEKKQYELSYANSVIASQSIIKNALPFLRKAVKADGDASIINIASMYGIVSPDLSVYDNIDSTNPPYYGVSKAGLLQLTRYASIEFGPEKIRTNSISPGPFPSNNIQNSNPKFVSRLAKKVPLKRIGKSFEIGGPVLFLASDASSYVNGANIVVDGGWTAW